MDNYYTPCAVFISHFLIGSHIISKSLEFRLQTEYNISAFSIGMVFIKYLKLSIMNNITGWHHQINKWYGFNKLKRDCNICVSLSRRPSWLILLQS